MRYLLVVLAISTLGVIAAPHPERSAFEVVRFVPPPGALVVGATPLFELDEPTIADADIARWHTVRTRNTARAMAELAALGATEISVRPRLTPAAIPTGTALRGRSTETEALAPSCPIKTPAYDARQGYLSALNVDAAWRLPGGRGAGVKVADVEGEWNEVHEDLPGARMEHVAGRRMPGADWRAHGTAVLGVVAAKDNGVGMVGIAPEVERIYTASLGQIGPARAFFEAAKRLDAGDVLIVELHGPGPKWDGRTQKGFVPMEWWQPEYDAIRWAASRGIIVIEAAGNGGQNLDDKVYKGRFDPAVRDSGAILIGAGAPTGAMQPRARLGFSNYGKRVNVQGWGGGVATLDYGDLQGCSDPRRKYTGRFSGTSSASPVVAGAALVIQGAFRARYGAVLGPRQMRETLVATGSPQAGRRAAREHIGPLPDVERALTALGVSRGLGVR